MIAPMLSPPSINGVVISKQRATLVLDGAVGPIMASAQATSDGEEGRRVVALSCSFSFGSNSGGPELEVGGDGSGDGTAMGAKRGQGASFTSS